MAPLIVAAAAWPIEWIGEWAVFERKLEREVAAAVAQGARLLVFPEYGSMELASLFPEAVYRSLPGQLEALQEVHDAYCALYRRLAGQHGVYLLAGSFPVRVAPQRYHNRAWLFGPDGRADYQDKLVMTRFENEQWGISAGDELKVFETALGRIAVNICYDSEFPLLARAQIEAGADILLLPSCTDTDAGYYRVRLSGQARALENQCFVVHAPTVGDAEWSTAVDVNRGAAAIYTPVDYGFPADGILALGARETAGWTLATLDLAQSRRLRAEGQVLNYRDWPRQHAPAAAGARLVTL